MVAASTVTTPVRSPTSADPPAHSAASPTASVPRESCADPVIVGPYTFAAASRVRLVAIPSVIHHSKYYTAVTMARASVLPSSAVTVVSVKAMPGSWSLSVAVDKSLYIDVGVCSELLPNYE